MDKQIIIREPAAPNDVARFWEELYAHFLRDVFPDPEDEDRAYFLESDYRNAIERLHGREVDPLHYLFFQRDGTDIGFAMAVIYTSEDGKCFILEFGVFPEFRGSGTGRSCAAALMEWARERGAAYFELNADTEQRQRFWGYSGFQVVGEDEHGLPLLRMGKAFCQGVI